MSTPLASVPSDLKEENRKAVLYAFRDSDMLTAAEVSEKTGISRQTVKKCIEYYIRNRLICSCGKGSSSQLGGKRPELFALNDPVRLMSILLHHHEIILNLTDLHYNNIAHWSTGYIRISSMDFLWQKIDEGVSAMLPRKQRDSVIGVCFVVPLGSDKNGRLTVATPFPGWPKSDYGRSLRAPLETFFPSACNIMLISDGQAAGSAIIQRDYETYSKGDLVTFYSSTGVGGALFHNGRLFMPEKQLVGAIGHIIVAPDDPETCGCGGNGCLERLVGRKRMRERLAGQPEDYARSALAAVPIEEMTFARLFEGSARGDSLCQRESRYYAEMFAVALRGIILTVDPEHVIFQGDFGCADEAFQRELLNRLFEFKYLTGSHNIRIEYDTRDLSEEETLGATYQLICDYLVHPEHYIE